jgi:hypothetical protein
MSGAGLLTPAKPSLRAGYARYGGAQNGRRDILHQEHVQEH